jgi:tetratricopeptide (TPR) repeat protein
MKGLAKPELARQLPDNDDSFWGKRENLLFLFVIIAITFVVYSPNLRNGFVNWDDSANIYENFYITNITNWKSLLGYLKGIFTTTVIGNYNPLAIFSFAVEKIIYGLHRPGMWHLDNIILHLICVFLVFRIAIALGLRLIPAAFCSLLFGIHPMRVESVAWVTERKDVLYGAFYLLALYYYIKSVRICFRKRYLAIIIISFIIALFSKIQAVALPLSMLAVDYYFDRKLELKLVYEKWIYFLLSLATGVVGVFFLKRAGMLESNKLLPFVDRFFIGTYSYVLYMIKSVVPYEMVPWYPYPDKIGLIYYLSIIPVFLVLGSICYLFLKKKKAFVFGLLFFSVNIFFLLQILSAGQGYLADRFTYIAYFGLFFIYAYLLQLLLEKYQKLDKIIYMFVVLILVVSGYVNFAQNKIWENGETMWSHVLNNYPDSYIAMKGRGNFYRDNGQLLEALADYSSAISLDSYNPKAFNSRGLLYYDMYFNTNDVNKLDLAKKDFTKAIELSPATGEFYVNRGRVYHELNMNVEALHDFDEAEKIEPINNNIYYNRSKLYIKMGKYEKAQIDIEKYLTLNPYYSDMWSNLGLVCRLNKQYEKSLRAFNRAIHMDPDKLFYYNNRLITYYKMGDLRHASDDLRFLKSKGFKDINPIYERILTQ